jgi:NAD(P)-dependent dehydrogenase (short-subunit alcohol dehydrogenase family)
MTATAAPNALIIGASRGLGLALTDQFLNRGWRAVATVRRGGRSGLHDLAERSRGLLEIENVDITLPRQIAELRSRLDGRVFDLLFVNAGVMNRPEETVGEISTEEFVRLMVTNALGPMRAVEALQDLVPATGTIGVMSSRLASITENGRGTREVYRASKAALNMLMRSFAARGGGDPRAMVVIAPGWVRTDMGGSDAPLSIGESIPGVVDAIVAQSGKAGLQFLDYQGKIVAW